MMPTPPAARTPVPWRTIWAVIAAVVITYLAYVFLGAIARILSWVVVALFFATVLNPAVDLLDRFLPGRRVLPVLIVFITGFALLAGMAYAFIAPLVDQTQKFVDDVQEVAEDPRAD